MIAVLFMLASFGLVFGFQNKLPWPGSWMTSPSWAGRCFQGFLGCSFCLGFWMGWLTGAACWVTLGCPVMGGWLALVLTGFAWSLSSSVLCLLLDEVLWKLERNDHER